MADYNKYKSSAGITNNDIIATVAEIYPSFTKVQCSMINNPEKHGMKLTNKAEQALADRFGYYEGLDIKAPRKREVKRSKTNRLAVRLTDEDYRLVKIKMKQMGCKNVQSFLEIVLTNLTEGED